MLPKILLYFPYIVASRWPMELNIGSEDRVYIQLSGVDNIVLANSEEDRGTYRGNKEGSEEMCGYFLLGEVEKRVR